MPYSRIREALESSSASVLHAVAAALSDAWYQPQPASPRQARLARLAAQLPAPLLQRVIARAVRETGLDPALTRYVHTEGLARQAVAVYDEVPDGMGYPAILIGAPNGGVAYLAALLRVPFLPAHFVLSFADPGDPDDIITYQAHGARLIEPILQRNPDLLAVNHYDPIHDRFLVAEVNHVRLKLLDLPQAYRTFIYQHLAPRGMLIFTDCSYSWKQYEIGPRHYMQVGGLGGYSDDDYRQGSEGLDQWLAAAGSRHRGGWQLDDYPLVSQRESEWGSLPVFREAVRRFAQAAGFDFRAVHGNHPEAFSALAYTAYLWEARLHERRPQALLIETFSQINPTAALRSDLLPLWMPFNCDDSLRFLSGFLDFIPSGLPVLLSLLANFTRSPDVPGAATWLEIVSAVGPVTWIGTHPERYPFDLTSRFDYLPQLQAWTAQHPGSGERPSLAPEAFFQMLDLLETRGERFMQQLLAF